jgi:hypothetical protein
MDHPLLALYLLVKNKGYSALFNFREGFRVGLAGGTICRPRTLGFTQNSYALSSRHHCYYHAGKKHDIEWPEGAIQPKWNGIGDVVGCGLALSPDNKFYIFFTGNGILLGQF